MQDLKSKLSKLKRRIKIGWDYIKFTKAIPTSIKLTEKEWVVRVNGQWLEYLGGAFLILEESQEL